MKYLFSNWRLFLLKENIINSIEILYHILPTKASEILIDKPKGQTKKFGAPVSAPPLPFHYGEWKNLINPSDNMGWDLIIVPSLSKFIDGIPNVPENLIPVGHVQYTNDDDIWNSILKNSGKEKPENVDQNTKIIIANNDWKEIDKDKKIIVNYFSQLPQFKKVKWY